MSSRRSWLVFTLAPHFAQKRDDLLRGCVSQGATREQTIINITEGIEALLKDDSPVPTEVGRETVEIQVSGR